MYSFETGGKDDLPADPSRLDRITHKLKTTFLQLQHPTRYAIIQVQPVVEQETVPGEAPPTPEADEDQPVVSVIMSRDLGDVRMPGAVLTIVSGLLFLMTLVMLHQRDLRAARGAWAPAGAGRGIGRCTRPWVSTSRSSRWRCWRSCSRR